MNTRTRHAIPGLGAVIVMTAVVVLASGMPGVAQPTPGRMYIDRALEQRLEADAHVVIVSDPVGDPNAKAPAKNSQPPKARHHDRYAPRKFQRNFRTVAYKAARRAGIKQPMLFVRQMAAESGFQPCARSGAGAVGIAQIMPGTAASWKVDPWIPEHALSVAARHMAIYERQLGSYTLALAAYNAGPGAVSAYGGVPPYEETRTYIARVTNRSYDLPGMRQVFRLPRGYQSSFARQLRDLRRDVDRHGGRVTVVSGWRGYPEQFDLWQDAKRRYGGWEQASTWVAPPGCSNHNRGLAADLGGDLGLAHKLAPRHGLHFPMRHEPWHVEPIRLPWAGGRL